MKRLISSLLVLTVILPFAASQAWTTCKQNTWNNTTTCTGDNGFHVTGRHNSWNNTTTWSGSSGGYGNNNSFHTTCRYNTWNNTTTCN